MLEENNGAPIGEHVDSPSTTEEQGGDTQPSPQPPEDGKTVPYDRFKQVNDQRKRYEEKFGPLDDDGNPLKEPQKQDGDLTKDIANLKESQAKIDFREEHNLSKDQVNWLWQHTGGSPTEDHLNDPGIKAALKEINRQADVEDNTPSSKRGAPTYNGKTWSEIANDPKISDQDKQKAYDALTNSKAGRR